MNFLTNWLKAQKNKVLVGLVAGLTMLSSLAFTDIAFADNSILAIISSTKAEPTTAVEQAAKSVDASIATWVEEIKLSFDQAVQEIKQVVEELPQQLAGGSVTGKAIGAKQDLLENVADSIDDLGEKVAKFNKRLQRSGTALSAPVAKNIQGLQTSLEDSAEAINLLADDTEKAKKGASTFLQTRIKQQVDIVKQALQASTEAFKLF